MVSVGMSKLGCTHLIFVNPGLKINGCHYREVLLSQQLLPAIRQVSDDFFCYIMLCFVCAKYPSLEIIDDY